MKKYIVAGLATAGLVLVASSGASAQAIGGLNAFGIQAVSNTVLANSSTQVAIGTGNAAIANQGIVYGDFTFQLMGGVNSNGTGINAGTGQSQVSVTAAGVINILQP